MLNSKAKKNIIYIIANLVLITIISIVYDRMAVTPTAFLFDKLTIYIISIGLLLFLFGLLTEYEKILEAYKNGFSINKVTFFIAIVMLIISCLPYGSFIPINIKVGVVLNYKIIRYIFSIWSGILVARSLVIKHFQ